MVRFGRPVLAGGLLLALHCNIVLARDLDRVNASLAGRVLDFTHHHGRDNRIWSESLGLWRDVYVYVPPGYDPDRAYPLFVWLHGFGGDEWQFIRQVVRALDQAIVAGDMPPVIAVAPDASLPRTWTPWYSGSWYINSQRGPWEDYIVQDVFGFMDANFKIRPEREAHIIAGWSMGGFGTYNLGFKHPDRFRLLVGIYPNLNLRYCDCRGHWGSDFDPDCVAWLGDMKSRWLIGCYPKYRFPIHAGAVFLPVWGKGQQCISRMSEENPLEMMERLDIQAGQFDMFISYGRRDEYNVDAQVDSFLHRARQRGLNIWVRFNPEGHHSTEYVNECMPDVLVALGARLRELLPELAVQSSPTNARPGASIRSPSEPAASTSATDRSSCSGIRPVVVLLAPEADHH